MLQQYFSKFWKLSKVTLLRSKLYFEGFQLGFRNWKFNPSILGSLQLLNQSFVSWKSNLKSKKWSFKKFSKFENKWFYLLNISESFFERKRVNYWVKFLLMTSSAFVEIYSSWCLYSIMNDKYLQFTIVDNIYY